MSNRRYRRTRHINAQHNEWVQVHRPRAAASASGSSSGGGDWVGAALIVVGWVVAAVALVALLTSIMPYLVFGALCWGALNVFVRK
jgi:hypothetical protein